MSRHMSIENFVHCNNICKCIDTYSNTLSTDGLCRYTNCDKQVDLHVPTSTGKWGAEEQQQFSEVAFAFCGERTHNLFYKNMKRRGKRGERIDPSIDRALNRSINDDAYSTSS